MIVRLTGTVVGHEGGLVVVDCSGVGYGVNVCIDEQAILPVGKEATLLIHENIKEDAHDLFGFLQATRRSLFVLLMSVSGVGPKAALSILNIGSEARVRDAVAKGDIKFITSANGVGKKVAERVVVDLKNKVGIEASEGAVDFLYDAPTTQLDDAVNALIELGYSQIDAQEALRGIDPFLSLEERVRHALRGRK